MRHVIPAEISFLFGMLLLAHARAYIAARVRLTLDRGCWEWQGRVDTTQYGRAFFMGEEFKAHRLAHPAFVGPIVRGRVVDHKECDNRPCCSPHHLLAVTQKKNMQRCWATGRGYSQFVVQ